MSEKTTNEFEILFALLSESGCDKKQTASGTYSDGVFVTAVNYCVHEGSECPRLTLPSGTGYELCQSKHAEATLAARLAKDGQRSDGIAWLVGHYWICEPCATALKGVNVTEIRIRET